jgi:hypothetical protein
MGLRLVIEKIMAENYFRVISLVMHLIFQIFDLPGPEIAAWAIAVIIAIYEFPYLKRFLVYLLMKLYGTFIQHNW